MNEDELNEHELDHAEGVIDELRHEVQAAKARAKRLEAALAAERKKSAALAAERDAARRDGGGGGARVAALEAEVASLRRRLGAAAGGGERQRRLGADGADARGAKPSCFGQWLCLPAPPPPAAPALEDRQEPPPLLTLKQTACFKEVCRYAVKNYVRGIRVAGADAQAVTDVLLHVSHKAKVPLLGSDRLGAAPSLYDAVADQLASGSEVVVVEGVDAASEDHAHLKAAEMKAIADACAASTAVLIFSTTAGFRDDRALLAPFHPIVVDLDGGADAGESAGQAL